ncbi:MAG: hypothetical protein ABIB79_02345 [archaeon]
MVILQSKKNVFWEALIITVAIFILGVFLGIAYEANRADDINRFVYGSEVNLMDIFIMNNLIDLGTVDCHKMVNVNLEFADKIFEEAKQVDILEASGRITEQTRLAHRRYDLFRTFLWINTIKILDKCPEENISSVIYLYELETDDLAQKANQNVWSKILTDLKEQKGSGIVLIPIAADANFTSLDSLIDKFEIKSYPVVIVNEEHVISRLTSVEDLEKYRL